MPLISNLKKQNQPATLDDFFYNCAYVHYPAVGDIDDSVIDYWNRWIGYNPKQLRDIFADEFAQGFSLKIYTPNFAKFMFSLERDGGEEYYRQGYDLLQHNIYMKGTRLYECNQSAGLGRAISMHFMDLDVALGIRRYQFTAEQEIGGYIWAKMGYYLDRSDGEKILEARQLSNTLLTKLQSLQGVLPQEVFNQAKTYAKLSNLDDLYYLANIGSHLTDLVTPDDFEKDGVIFSALCELTHSNGDALLMSQKMKKVVLSCAEKGLPLTIGKLLLMGEKWNAIAEYDNDAQMQRIIAYGGQKNLGFSLLGKEEGITQMSVPFKPSPVF